MDLIALLPAPLITLAVQIIKKLGLPDGTAPWVALGLAVVSTIVIHILGVTESVVMDALALLVAWLGSMGTWEALKNLVLGRFNRAEPTA